MSFLCTKDKIFGSYRQSKILQIEKDKSKVLGKFAIERHPGGGGREGGCSLCKIKNAYKRNDNSTFPKLN